MTWQISSPKDIYAKAQALERQVHASASAAKVAVTRSVMVNPSNSLFQWNRTEKGQVAKGMSRDQAVGQLHQ